MSGISTWPSPEKDDGPDGETAGPRDGATATGFEAIPKTMSEGLSPGTVLGSYRITRELGRGGMGFVYEAEHLTLGRHVALKLLPRELAENATAVRRFFAEARAVNAIHHPGLIEVIDFVEGGPDATYYVMELLHGHDCASLVAGGIALPVDDVFEIGIQATDTLAAVHAAGVIHRDVKPHNIFIVRDDGALHVKLLDFGIAKLQGELSEFAAEKTRDGAIIGTPEYMSPEQAAGKPIDARADVYAMGVVLFELATGRRPFIGSSFGDYVIRHMTLDPPRLREVGGAQIPASLEHVVALCLEKVPSARPQSMTELRGLLEAAREARHIDVPMPAPSSDRAAARRPRGLVAAAAAAIVVVAIAIGWRALGTTEPTTPVVDATPAPVEAPRRLRVTSTPEGATVIDRATGRALGATPLVLEDGADVRALRLVKDGHLDVDLDVPAGAEVVSTTLPATPAVAPVAAPVVDVPRKKPPRGGKPSASGTKPPEPGRDPSLERRATMDPFAE